MTTVRVTTARGSFNATTVALRMCGIWLGVALVVLLVAGCGESSVASTNNAHTAQTGEQAATFAQAVNLRAGDVPGLVAVGGSRSSEIAPLGSLGSACHVATVPAGSLVAVSSPTFQRRQQSAGGSTSYLPLEAVSSEVYVERSAALASREIAEVEAAAKSSAVVSCLKRHLLDERANVVGEGSKAGVPAGKPLFSNVEVSTLRPPVQGISAFGLRISADFVIKVPGTKGPSRYYQDFFGFAVGSAVVVLSDTGSPQPFPVATEQRLLSLLHSRAKSSNV